jgi:hypothetical protein
MFSAKSALLGFAMGFATITAANANALITWDPNAVGLGTAGLDGPFSFNNITTADYTDIHVTSATATTLNYTETGLLNLSAFSGGSGSPLGLGRPSLGFISPPSITPNPFAGYVIYASFTGTGTLPTSSLSLGVGQTAAGTLDALTYTLFAAPASGGLPTFGANTTGGTLSNTGANITLATGSLLAPGTATLTNSNTGGLSAQALFSASFVPDPTVLAANPSFYVAPTTYIDLNLFSSSTNTGTVLTLDNGPGGTGDLIVNGGGGNATFNAVPEPTSLAILGVGLVALGRFARRQTS